MTWRRHSKTIDVMSTRTSVSRGINIILACLFQSNIACSSQGSLFSLPVQKKNWYNWDLIPNCVMPESMNNSWIRCFFVFVFCFCFFLFDSESCMQPICIVLSSSWYWFLCLFLSIVRIVNNTCIVNALLADCFNV